MCVCRQHTKEGNSIVYYCAYTTHTSGQKLETRKTQGHTQSSVGIQKKSFSSPSPSSTLQLLERLVFLNLSHNSLSTLQGLHAFVALSSLNLSYNLVAAYSDLKLLTELQRLDTLSLMGKNIALFPCLELPNMVRCLQLPNMMLLCVQSSSVMCLELSDVMVELHVQKFCI